MRPTRNLIERLRDADPLPEAERLSEAEREDADRLLARILADEPVRRRLSSPRPRVRRWALAVAATACALALVLALVDDDAEGPSIVERAVAAVSEPDAIYHVVALDGSSKVRFYSESWTGPDHAVHARVYIAADGGKGKLIGEIAGRLRPQGHNRYSGPALIYNAEQDTVLHIRFKSPGFTGEPASFDPSRDPGAGLRRLVRSGTLEPRGTAELDGKRAYRLVALSAGGRHPTIRYEYLVDADTYYPLLYRELRADTGEVVARTRYLRYEKLPNDPALLKLDPHPGATHVDQRGRPLGD